MSAGSKIEWTDATWNPVRARAADGRTGTHCEHVSEGCRHCYAETFNRRGLPGAGTGLDYKPGHRDGLEHFIDEKMLLAPLKRRKPTRYFLSSLTDVFGAWVSDAMLDRLWAVMALCPQHVFQVLTKRPERAREYLKAFVAGKRGVINAAVDWERGDEVADRLEAVGKAYPACCPFGPLPNVWLGTSVEDQEAADERIPHLLATPAAVRFLSCEPLLSAVDLTHWLHDSNCPFGAGVASDCLCCDPREVSIDWVIVGGESGKGARPMHPDWARGLRDQCAAAGVPFFFKQWGWCLPGDMGGESENGGPAWRFGEAVVGEREWLTPEQEAASGTANARATTFGFEGEDFLRFKRSIHVRLLDGVQHDGMPS